jgi:hypothetical protein
MESLMLHILIIFMGTGSSPMKKFIIQSERNKTSIIEVEIELVTAMEDPSIKWLPEGEYKARILQPKSLYEKQEDGTLVSPLWYSHAFYCNKLDAWTKLEKMIRDGFERDKRKEDIDFTETDVQAKLGTIQEIMLP